MLKNEIKLLIVDDSAIIRKILSDELSKYPDIHIIATAPDPYVARDKIIQYKPDVMTLDVEMPRMDGVTFLEKLMRNRPIPTIILSTLTSKGCDLAIRAFEVGALEVMHKPEVDVSYKLTEMIEQLVEKIRAAYLARNKINNKPVAAKPSPVSSAKSATLLKTTDKVVAIGASTGGTEALRAILPALPANFPGIVIAQHMPANFTKSFADSLNASCALEVKEAQDNDTIRPGLALLAPGNYHMITRRSGTRYYVNLQQGPMIHHQRPAVDVLFNSVAKYIGKNAVGVILTGMGKDGAGGLLKMKQSGAKTIGQDEKSCVVYGMPKVAFESGAVEFQKPLEQIPVFIMQLLSQL
jgi:two-component system chemotaxis response regulator CheB